MSQIYLISPPKIESKTFLPRLEKALKTNLVPVFQLRLKEYSNSELTQIAKEIKKICDNNNCLFLLNDSLEIALDICANGVHLGAEDDSILSARKNSPENFLIGASCYDSKHLAMEAGEQGADYLSFGAFFESKTKKSRGNPSLEILEWSNEILNLPTVAIGGITADNCAPLVKRGADFLSVISYVWDHPEGEEAALIKLSQVCK
jgi:thiamine-phosphate pyrophosphorylase